MAGPTGSANDMMVVLVRAWYEDDQFRARIMFDPHDSDPPQSVVVQSIDEVCVVFRTVLEATRRPES